MYASVHRGRWERLNRGGPARHRPGSASGALANPPGDRRPPGRRRQGSASAGSRTPGRLPYLANTIQIPKATTMNALTPMSP